MSIFGLRLTLWGLAVAILMVVAYCGYRYFTNRKIDGFSAGTVGLSGLGTVGGIKLCVLAWMPEFERAAKASEGVWYSLSESDAPFLFLGGAALIWLTVLGAWRAARQ